MTERACPNCDCCDWPPHGACPTYERGMNGRCVYCDHDRGCHEAARPHSAAEAATLLGISNSRVRRYCIAGRVPGAYKIGRAWLIPASGIASLRAQAEKQRNAGKPGRPSAIGK